MLGDLVDERVKSFVDEYVDSLVSWAIIVFFHENQGARDRAEDLALHLGRRADDVRKSAERLSEKGLLKRSVQETAVVYIYHPDGAMKKSVERFVKSLDEREVRLAILSSVLEKTA